MNKRKAPDRGTSSPELSWWHRDRFAARLANLKARTAIAAAVRGYFASRDFLEVETPALQVSPGLEPHLMAFATDLNEPFGQGKAQLYLHTSPEFTMKKLLAAGVERQYQLARVFRNGERSATHHPEFTMLEWYRAGAGIEALIDDCRGLLNVALAALPDDMRDGQGFRWRGQRCDPASPWQVLTVADAFQRHTGIDILATAPDPQNPDRDLLRDAARQAGLTVRSEGSWEDLFFHIFLDRIEPHLGIGAPTVLTHYPASMAALARLSPADPRVAERLELYVCGLELANGFGELTDANEQRRRFEADMTKKEALYGFRYPLDEDFLAALAAMPESAGIALGFDRLVMLATGAERIEDVLWAPVAHAR